MCSFLSACGANEARNVALNELEQLKKQVTELKAENQELKNQLENNPQINTEQSDKSEPTTEVITNSNIILNEPLIVPDFAEITLKKVNATARINPPKPDSYYTYYEVKDSSNILLDIVVNIKSLMPSGKTSDEFISAKVKYDNKYEYDSFSTIETGGGQDFTYTNIDKN